MILASSAMIRECTEKGAWETRTFIDYFKANVAIHPDHLCPVDAIPGNPVGKEPGTDIQMKLEEERESGAQGNLHGR